MKQTLLLVAFAVFGNMLFSQAVPMALKDWETNAGTQTMFQKNVVKTDGSGNVYTAGATLNTNGKYDILLTKVTSGGTAVYTKTVNGTANEHDFALGMLVSGTDVFITGAITNNTTTLAPDLFIAKYNSSGVQQFFTTFSNGYGDVGRDIAINTTHNYIIVSGASYDNTLHADMLAVVFDHLGNEQYNVTHDYNGLHDAAYKVTTRTNLFTITGPVTQSTNNYKLASQTYSVLSGLPSGSITVGATATSSVEIISDLVTDASGNFYICGATQQNAGQGYDMYVAKVTSSLTISWEQTINGYSGSSGNDFAKGIKINASGDVFVTGVTTHSTQGKNMTTVKLNSSGAIQWRVDENGTFNGNDGGADLDMDASSNVYVTGFKTVDANNTDFYSVKYNSSGTKIWEVSEQYPLNDEGTNLVLDNNDNIIIAGSHEYEAGTFEYLTYKYDQKDILTPTDFNGETPSNNFMYFRNSGQLVDTNQAAVPQIKYYTHNTYPSFYFKDRNQSFVFARIDTVAATADTLHRIDLDFTNSIESSKTYAMDQQENGYLNYFLAHTGSRGITGVKGNLRLVTPELYSNIDLMCSSNQNGIKYYFIVKPGGDMRDIKMEFTGATSYSLNGTTNHLSINSSIGSFTFDKPVAYQLTAGNATVAVTSFSPTWTTDGAANKYKFNDGTYTSSLTLVIEVDQGNGTSSAAAIDNLHWSTYYGGPGGEDIGYSIKNDNTGNIYVGGRSTNPNFPTSNGASQTSFSAGDVANGVLMKFDISRVRQWSTYYGGGNEDAIMSISFDNTSNQMYVAGYTASANFPVINKTGTTASPSHQGSSDGFIASFNIATGHPSWTNLIGTSGNDRVYSIHVNNGNKYLVGYVENGLTLVNTASFYQQATYAGGFSDGAIAKFSSSDQLQWLTYYGGNLEDYPKSVTTDASGNIIVWGETVSTTFNTHDPDPIGHTAIYNTTNAGQVDFFIVKFNSDGARLWATLYGGNGAELAADGDGIITVGNDIYCFGTTFSTNMPIQQFGSTPTYNQNGSQDCYIVCFNSSYQEKWATYFGGSDIDWAGGITKDNNNNIFITGATNSSDYNNATQAGFYDGNFYGTYGATGTFCGDAFITAFANNSFAPVWSTFMGGSYNDVGNSISIFNNRLFITGFTSSHIEPFGPSDLYPVIDPGNSAYQYSPPGSTGGADVLISEFSISNMSTQVGITEHKESDFEVFVYPNPFASEIKIKGLNNKSLYKVYDLTGKQILSDNIKSEENVVNLSVLSSGMYLLKIINENGNYKTYKIIKNN